VAAATALRLQHFLRYHTQRSREARQRWAGGSNRFAVAAAAGVVDPPGVETHSPPLVVGGHSGIFIHIEVQAKEVIRMQWVVAGTRLYTISAENRKGHPNELEGKNDFETVAMGFIDRQLVFMESSAVGKNARIFAGSHLSQRINCLPESLRR
jgi:hypothetical protein